MFTNFELMDRPLKSKVYFFTENVKVRLFKTKNLKNFIEKIVQKERKKITSIIYVFCNDDKLYEINKQFLKHDFLTDIITFNLSETEFIQGEIYISIDRVRENAKNFGISVKDELLRIIIHGVLHLCGYGDNSLISKKIMKRKEDRYINFFKTHDYFT